MIGLHALFRFSRATQLLPALASMILFSRIIVYATEFGGIANLNYSTNVLEYIFLPQWRETGDLKWIRNTAPWLAEQGIDQISVVNFAPESARSDGGRDLPDDLLVLYWHCRTNLPVYPNVRQAWEVWNEPDFHFVRDNPDRMAAVLKAAYWGIKAGNPKATVLMPSLAFNPDKYPRQLAQNDIYPYTEGYNFHYYGWAHDFLPSVAQHRRFLKEQGWNLPVWITEAGYLQLRNQEENDPIGLARQQAFHERLAVTAYVERVDYYLAFILTPYTEEGLALGLTTSGYVPRPALNSYLRLTRLLPTTKPLFRIFHRPTSSEIGVVLAEADGNWWTILWSPYRWKDFLLPTKQRLEKPDIRVPERRLNSGSTDLELTLRFPTLPKFLKIGLEPEEIWTDRTNPEFTVSATQNLHLRTSPRKFEILDCEWKPFRAGEDGAGRREEGGGRREDSGGNLKSEVEDREGRKPAAGQVKPAPSPVILQINYDPATVTSDKPSQTYRYNPQRPLTAKLDVYNFSEEAQAGSWTAELPEGWKIKLLVHTGNQKRETDGNSAEPTGYWPPATRLTVPAMSKISIPLDIYPSLNGWRGARVEGGKHEGNGPRRSVRFRWQGANNLTDSVATSVEPNRSIVAPNLRWSLRNWEPVPERPNQWAVTFPRPNMARYSLREIHPNGGFVSFYVALPKGLRLSADHRLRAEIRLNPARTNAYFRVNFVTSEREVFRYTEILDFGTSWTEMDWRIGDFGPFFWSRVANEYDLPIERFRYLRISAGNLKVGDTIEVRNLGISK